MAVIAQATILHNEFENYAFQVSATISQGQFSWKPVHQVCWSAGGFWTKVYVLLSVFSVFAYLSDRLSVWVSSINAMFHE